MMQFLAWLSSLFAPRPQALRITYAQTPYGFSMPVAAPKTPSTVSYDGLEFVKREEGFQPKAYWDVKQWAIGYGHKIRAGDGLNSSSVITKERATQLLLQDMQSAINAVKAVAASMRVPLTQGQFDALVSLAYNIGNGNFAGSTLVKRLKAGDISGAYHEIAEWKHAGGRPILADRRAREQRLFLS